jgi:dihydrolipoamide dehydrogenase
MDQYDYAVIGSGPGGYVSAIRAAQLGLKVVLIEKDATLGGTCLNVGCIPSKALLESSELFHKARHGLDRHGIQLGDVQLDLGAMMERKRGVVKELTDGVGMLMKKNKITVEQGFGVLKGPGRVEIHDADGGSKEIEAKTIVLAMGSVPVELPFLKFDGDRVVSSTEALELDEVPERMVVVGAGAIGLEMGSVWARLGSEVTVIELLPRITPFADAKMGKLLQRSLKKQGLQFHLDSKVTGAEVGGDTVKVSFTDAKGNDQQLECDRLLVAVGRRPFTEGCGLEEAGVEIGDGGRVTVDDRWQTSVQSVYAIGDLIHGPMLAHKAEDEGVAVAEQAAGQTGHVNYNVIPNVVYTEPELAQVGLTEEELKERDVPYTVGTFYFKANGRAKSLDLTEGQLKILAHEETDRVLGVHIVGTRASEMIAEAAAVMEFGGSAEDIALTCHAHPTLPEIMREAAMAVHGRAIHS